MNCSRSRRATWRTKKTRALALVMRPSPSHRCYVALGANLGHPMATVRAAAQKIAALSFVDDFRGSSLYLSAPREIRAVQPDYINAVVTFTTATVAIDVWRELESIEGALGRIRSGARNEARKIDIDFLLYGDLTMATVDLTLPHPRIAQRAFVLLPLLELAPTIQIPGIGPAHALLANVQEQSIKRLNERL
jgi:2-amino-4-hydroxy-6-hydroxymethyldihydropteridine diphosphokinase